MNTPYFLIDNEKLERNIENFQDALHKLWPNSKLAYSVKTNSLPWLLRRLCNDNVLAEVVSDEEYQLARLCGYSDDSIVYNGPIKGEKQFKVAIDNRAYLNLDSARDLKYLKKYAKDGMYIGIRVNVPPNVFCQEDIEYMEQGFRFGFSEQNGQFLKALNVIRELKKEVFLGIHLHCNSITRNISVYKAIAKYAADLILKYDLRLSFIDMGGGYFGGVEGKPTPLHYIQVIKNELCSVVDLEKTMLIVEPGSAIIGSVVDFYTSVLDVKDTFYSRIVTTDGSRIHIDPLWAKSHYMYTVQSNNKNYFPEQIICGYTCMDHDRIMTIKNDLELLSGDKIIYHRVGAYSMTFGGMFIRYLPDVYVETDGERQQVRQRISAKDYYQIHTNV